MSNVVSITTFASDPCSPSRIRVASIPSTAGMRTSISTTCGLRRSASSTASPPFGRLADHFDVVVRVEDHPEARADKGLVVDDQDADAAVVVDRGRPGSAATAAISW